MTWCSWPRVNVRGTISWRQIGGSISARVTRSWMAFGSLKGIPRQCARDLARCVPWHSKRQRSDHEMPVERGTQKGTQEPRHITYADGTDRTAIQSQKWPLNSRKSLPPVPGPLLLVWGGAGGHILVRRDDRLGADPRFRLTLLWATPMAYRCTTARIRNPLPFEAPSLSWLTS